MDLERIRFKIAGLQKVIDSLIVGALVSMHDTTVMSGFEILRFDVKALVKISDSSIVHAQFPVSSASIIVEFRIRWAALNRGRKFSDVLPKLLPF